MRYLIVASLFLSCSLCLAEDFPENTNEIKSLTAEQAADIVAPSVDDLYLYDLTSIDKEVAQELAKVKSLHLGLTSIDKDVAKELAKFKGKQLYLSSDALRTYEEVNGGSPSVRAGGML